MIKIAIVTFSADFQANLNWHKLKSKIYKNAIFDNFNH